MTRLGVLLTVALMATAPTHAEESIYTAFPLKGFTIEWYSEDGMLAERGDRNAMLRLITFYSDRSIVPPDYAVAYMWADIAADLGDEKSRYTRDIIGRKLTPSEIEEARRLADAWMDDHPELVKP